MWPSHWSSSRHSCRDVCFCSMLHASHIWANKRGWDTRKLAVMRTNCSQTFTPPCQLQFVWYCCDTVWGGVTICMKGPCERACCAYGLSVYLPVCLPVCLPACLHVYIYMPVSLSLSLTLCLCLSASVLCLCHCLSACPSVCVCVSLSLCLSLSVSLNHLVGLAVEADSRTRGERRRRRKKEAR